MVRIYHSEDEVHFHNWRSVVDMGWFDLSCAIETVLTRTIRESVRKSWIEDHITLGIAEDLEKEFNDVNLDLYSPAIKILWESYKIRTKPEESDYGDLAFLVRIEYFDSHVVEGVGFQEAKVRVKGKNTFDASKFGQLQRMVRHAYHHHLLLYDYENINPAAVFEERGLWFHNYPIQVAPVTNSVVVPTNFVNEKDKSIGLYRISLPFSYLITHRYLQGLDLEFDKKSLDVAKGITSKYGNPSCLIVVSITKDGNEPTRPDINNNVYQRVQG